MRDDGGSAADLSLRDYFAASALAGELAAEAHPEGRGIAPMSVEEADGYALVAYKLADAMLKAREAQPEPTLIDQLKASLEAQAKAKP